MPETPHREEQLGDMGCLVLASPPPSKLSIWRFRLSVALLIIAPCIALGTQSPVLSLVLRGFAALMLIALMVVYARLFGVSWASVTLLAFMYPILVTMYLAPSGNLFIYYNARSAMEEGQWALCVGGMIYYYVVFAWLIYKGKKDFVQFDRPAVSGLRLSRTWSKLLAVVSISLAYAAMPGIPAVFTGAIYLQFAGIDRESTGIAGAGASLIPLFLCGMCYLSEKTVLRSIAICLVPLWYLLNFARVDAFGLFLLYIVCAVNGAREGKYRTRTAKLAKLAVAVALLILIAISSVVNIVRSGQEFTYRTFAETMVTSAFSNDTAQGIAYAAMVCIDQFAKDSSDMSQPWTPRDILPATLGGTPDGALGRLQLEGLTGGGAYAPFEAYLAGGPIVFLLAPFLIYMFIFGLTHVFTALFGPLGSQASYIVLMLSILRWPWYGIRTLSSPFLLLVPLVLVAVSMRFLARPLPPLTPAPE